MYPGRIIKAKVDSIVWAQGQGQVTQSGVLPQTGVFPQVPGRFPVKFDGRRTRPRSVPRRRRGGRTARSTPITLAFIHIIRKVILRVGSITDYLVLKLH